MPGPSGKRALIVDDSKSARAFLTRALEKCGLEVDSVESAEQAIEQLETLRPDVIFMDHLMPGMDGFQAVHSIRHNPRTATIPIMMYTSQEGELYLGQARALGAMGVLPKQVKHAELSSTLFQLGLLTERRSESSRGPRARGEAAAVAPLFQSEGSAPAPADATSAAAPVAVDTVPSAAPSADGAGSAEAAMPAGGPPATPAIAPLTAAELRPVVESVLREQFGELRRHVEAMLEQQSARWLDELRAAVVPPPPPTIALDGFADERRSGRAPAWALAVAATLAAAALGVLWWRESQVSRELLAQLLDVRRASATQVAPALQVAPSSPGVAAPSAVAASDAPAAGSDAAPTGASAGAAADLDAPVVRAVPYGELPLAGERLEALRALVADLASRGVRGVVSVVSYPGRFCLVGSPAQGFAPASDELAVTRCDVVGNPFDEALLPGQRESLAVANFVGSVRQQSGGALRVELATGAESEHVRPYPAESAALTAGEWNRAAAANNRIEIRLRREPS